VLFAAERLHQGHRGEDLGDPVGDLLFLLPLLFGRGLGGPVAVENNANLERDRGHDYQRQLPVQEEHDAEHPEEGERLRGGVEGQLREDVSQGVGIADDLGQVFTGLRAVVEGEGEPLEVGEEPSPHGVNQLAADTRGDVYLQVGEYPGKGGDQNDGDRDRKQRQHLPALKQSLEGREVPGERFVRQYVVEDDR
jgi:hypothetical protein